MCRCGAVDGSVIISNDGGGHITKYIYIYIFWTGDFPLAVDDIFGEHLFSLFYLKLRIRIEEKERRVKIRRSLSRLRDPFSL
jgi:hypothetical protein